MRSSTQEEIDLIVVYNESHQCLRGAVCLYEKQMPERNFHTLRIIQISLNLKRLVVSEIKDTDERKQ